ncbi:unnamed protein product [Lupinus luteus]|uniref:Protein kinase domain-containing protein n=1 Tax=Lupinus luteus TaxID=3873 RepID=A0AAV1W3N1_LUPLU
MGGPNVGNPNFNITGVFTVDPNFSYFIRVHFCDIMSKSLNTLVFNLFINTGIALGSFDLSSSTNGLAVPYYKDFISNASAGFSTLTVSVGPDTMADITNATMNGLEIMKIINALKSLDGLSSVDSLLPRPPSKKNRIRIIVGYALEEWNCKLHFFNFNESWSFFSFQEILDGTNKFDEKLLLGVGGFGRVYKGSLEDGTSVAVKRGNPRSEQGLAEFRTEIEMLSKLRHRHLVSLIGHCDERPALNPVLPREQVNIVEWAMIRQKKGMLDQIMDQNLVGKVNLASLKKFGETSDKCLAEYGVDRPSMGDILWNLEYALQLQETSSALMNLKITAQTTLLEFS